MLTILSGILSDVNGKLGGSCFARNHYGLYLKNWKVPANPPSIYSDRVRDNFRVLVLAWQNLNGTLQKNWNALGKTIWKKNRVGELYNPTGYDLFLSCNQNLFLIDQPSLSIPPVVPSWKQCTASSVIYDPVLNSFSGTLQNGSIESAVYYLIYISKRLSPGIFYMKMNFAGFGYLDDSTLNWSIASAAYNTRFGYHITPGYKYFFKFIPIHKTTGFAGLEFKTDYSVLPIPGNYWTLDISELDLSTILT